MHVLSIYRIMKYYYINMVPGMNLCRENMENIPYPNVELTSHITMKTTQAGSWFGTAIGPLVALAKGRSGCKEMEQAAFVGGKFVDKSCLNNYYILNIKWYIVMII